VALATIALIAAAPAWAEDLREVETRVKINHVSSRIVNSHPPSASYRVRFELRSPEAGCRNGRRVKLVHRPGVRSWTEDSGATLYWNDELEFPFTREHERVKVSRSRPQPNGEPRRETFICKGDRSRRLTFPRPSEAGIAAAPASAAEEVTEAKTRVKISFAGTLSGEDFFMKGEVQSPVKKCERRRLVKLVGGSPVRGYVVDYTTARTKPGGGHRGRFSLDWVDPNPPAHYRIKAPRSFPRKDGSLKCKADVKRFRTPEAGIAAAPASAEDLREVETRVKSKAHQR
jgi:hypothetical protein